MGDGMTRPVVLPHPTSLAALDLPDLDRRVAELTGQAQAYVGDLHRVRRAAIRTAVDGDDRAVVDGEPFSERRRTRVLAIAAILGISPTQVYQAIRLANVAESDGKG
jgi:hypothetical protein